MGFYFSSKIFLDNPTAAGCCHSKEDKFLKLPQSSCVPCIPSETIKTVTAFYFNSAETAPPNAFACCMKAGITIGTYYDTVGYYYKEQKKSCKKAGSSFFTFLLREHYTTNF